MSLLHPVVFSFFWGGQIISSPSWGVEYSPPVANRAVPIRDKLTYDELVELICKVASIDKNVFKVNVIFRQPRCVGSHVWFTAIKLADDEDMEMIFDSAMNLNSHYVDIYVETELITSVCHPRSNMGPFVSLLSSVPHLNTLSSLSLPVSLNESTLPVHVVGSASREIIDEPVHTYTEECGIDIENLDVRGGETNVNIEAESDANSLASTSDDSMSTEAESVAPEDVGSDDDCDSDHDVPPYIPRGLAFFNDHEDLNASDPTDRGDDIERIYFWSEENNTIRLGMRFQDKQQLKKAITLWSIRQNREFKVVESKSNTWVAKYKMEATASHDGDNRRMRSSCLWGVRAICKSTHGMWQITKWVVTEHNCLGENLASHHYNLTSPVIATHITHSIETNPCYPVKSIQADIKQALHVDISYKKAWHGHRKAIELVYGSWDESFSEMPKYMEAL